MTLSEELTWRGFVNQTTISDITDLDKEKRTFYIGFDASADSQTIGNMAVMMMAHTFMRHGYRAVILAGGATSLIGDPGGKDKERPMQSEETIAKNVANAETQLKKIFEGESFTLVNNLDWTRDMSVLTFLREIGKHFSMTQLIGRDYIAKRLGEGGEGISYTEFSYTLLQGMDYLHLYREYGATLQLAGSDQWGNSISGVDLIRKAEGVTTHAWTAPLIINKTTGKKFGKSEEGAVWLDPVKTTPFQFYQFWLNADDAGVIDYLKIYTLLEKDVIDRLEEQNRNNPGARHAQRTLAYEVTKLVHGVDRAEQSKNVTAALFGDTPFDQLIHEEIDMLAREIPVATSSNVINALVTTGVCSSNSEAKRLMDSGAISVNGEKISSDTNVTVPSLIKKGKNTFVLVR